MVIAPATRCWKSGAVALAESILDSIRQTQFPYAGHCTCSIGVAELQADEDVDSLLHKVDQRMYQAKDEGRDRIAY